MHYCWLKSSTLFKCSPQPKLLLFVTVVTVVQRPASRKWQKTRVKPENTWDFPGIFGYYPHWTRDRRGSLPGLPYCCSVGLTLATVVGGPHCCSVVTVNTSNTVQLLTLGNPIRGTALVVATACRSSHRAHATAPADRDRAPRRLPRALRGRLTARSTSVKSSARGRTAITLDECDAAPAARGVQTRGDHRLRRARRRGGRYYLLSSGGRRRPGAESEARSR